MVTSVPRLLLAVLLAGLATTAHAEVCLTIDESRDALPARDRAGAIVLLTTQFELEGERVVAAGCADPFVLFHSQLGSLVVVTVSGRGRNWQATAQTTEDIPAIYSQIARSIVTGRPMTGLNVVDRTNVTSAQAERRRVHTDSIWYGRLGYGAVFSGGAYETPSLGFGYRAELDNFAIDLSFLNLQLPSPGGYASPGAHAATWLKLSGLRFVSPEANRSAYYGGGLSYGHTSVHRDTMFSFPNYSTSWNGSGLQGELTAGYELARATTLRMFVQADVVLPFYQATSETFGGINGPVSRDSRYAPSLVLSVGIGR